MEQIKQISRAVRLPLTVGLLNVTGLGLGYLYMKRWLPWLLRFLVTLGLLTIACFGNASSVPPLWLTVFSLWLLWMAFDGAWQARRLPQPAAEGAVVRQWLPLALAVLLIICAIAGLVGYIALGQQEFTAGMTAYRSGNCRTALQSFERVTTLYELTLSPNIASADEKMVECSQFVAAEDIWKKGQHADAISGYKAFAQRYPNSVLVPFARNAIAKIYSEWADRLRAAGDNQTAIEKYQVVLAEYPDTSTGAQAKQAIAETYSEWAAQLRKDGKYEDALKKYQLILVEYSATPSGRRTPDLIAETYAEWAIQLRRVGNYRMAIERYRVILNEYPNTPTGAQAKAAVAETYGEWATQLRKDKRYDEAIDKYQTLLKNYADTPTGKEAKAAAAETYGEWAAQLRTDKRYDEAVAKYQTLLRDYSDTPSGKQVAPLMIQAYAEWGDKLRADGKYKDAIEKYQYVTRNSALPDERQVATKAIAETYNGWGKWHYYRQEYLEAMEKHTLAKNTTNVPDVVTAADKGYNDALVGLSEDTTGQGKKVMDQALAEVLAGKPASSPAVGLAKDQPGKALFSGYGFTLPADLKAVKPSHFRYVISLESGYDQVQDCGLYTGRTTGRTYTVIRRQSWWRIKVRETRTAVVAAEKVFYGSEPAWCPSETTATIGVSPVYLSGGLPSGNDVIAWLRTIVR